LLLLLLVLVLLVLQAGVRAQELRQEQLQQERYELERKLERAADRVYSSANRWSTRSPLTRCENISPSSCAILSDDRQSFAKTVLLETNISRENSTR